MWPDASLCGSHGLSDRRARGTKSRRPKGPPNRSRCNRPQDSSDICPSLIPKNPLISLLWSFYCFLSCSFLSVALGGQIISANLHKRHSLHCVCRQAFTLYKKWKHLRNIERGKVQNKILDNFLVSAAYHQQLVKVRKLLSWLLDPHKAHMRAPTQPSHDWSLWIERRMEHLRKLCF